MLDRKTKDMWVNELINAVDILNEAWIIILAYDWIIWAKAYMHGEEWGA